LNRTTRNAGYNLTNCTAETRSSQLHHSYQHRLAHTSPGNIKSHLPPLSHDPGHLNRRLGDENRNHPIFVKCRHLFRYINSFLTLHSCLSPYHPDVSSYPLCSLTIDTKLPITHLLQDTRRATPKWTLTEDRTITQLRRSQMS
jgi:hypothetical protein